jgi:hypothetical protein
MMAIIPIAVEVSPFQIDRGRPLIADLDPNGVMAIVQFSMDLQAGTCRFVLAIKLMMTSCWFAFRLPLASTEPLRKREPNAASTSTSRPDNSVNPLRMVFGERPVAQLTARPPPHPYACASVAAQHRRMRSSILGASEWYFNSIFSMVVASRTATLKHNLTNKSTYFGAAP